MMSKSFLVEVIGTLQIQIRAKSFIC